MLDIRETAESVGINPDETLFCEIQPRSFTNTTLRYANQEDATRVYVKHDEDPVPANLIAWWSEAIEDIPAGWVHCNGENETRDLRNSFIVGAGDTFEVGDNAAAEAHTHTGTTDGHYHEEVGQTTAGAGGETAWKSLEPSNTEVMTFETDPNLELPPYHALALIVVKNVGVAIMESGIIVLFEGAIIDIPDGYVLCDGDNGTPDLTNLFILGAGDTYAVDETGGGLVHRHNGTTDGHHHHQTGETASGFGGETAWGAPFPSTTVGDGFVSDQGGKPPPYYALAFMMKT